MRRLAGAAAFIVAAAYVTQPIVAPIAADFGVQLSNAWVLPLAAQGGYAMGVLLILPLSDFLSRRALLASQLAVAAAALLGMALVPTFALVCVLSAVVGFASQGAQLMLAQASQGSSSATSARSIAMIGAGVLAGIFIGRVLAGFFTEYLGWRSVIIIFAGVLLVLLLRHRALMSGAEAPGSSRSRFTVADALILLPAGLRQAAVFLAFSAVWATIAIYLVASLGWSEGQAGLAGWIGVAAAAFVPALARRVRVERPSRASRVALGWVAVGFLVITVSVWAVWVPGIFLGLFVVSAFAQIAQVSHQLQFMRERPTSSGRSNSVYLSVVFAGGALGAALGVAAYAAWGFTVVAAAATVVSTAALLAALPRRKPRER